MSRPPDLPASVRLEGRVQAEDRQTVRFAAIVFISSDCQKTTRQCIE